MNASENSFHAASGIYESAEPPLGRFVALQYVPLPSLNMVPPIAVTSGNADGVSTVLPLLANGDGAKTSQSPGPKSPAEFTHVIPWALACCAIARIVNAQGI